MTLYVVCVGASYQVDSVWTSSAQAAERKNEVGGIVLPYEANHAPLNPGGSICACGQPVFLPCASHQGPAPALVTQPGAGLPRQDEPHIAGSITCLCVRCCGHEDDKPEVARG